jgi:MFS family permease
MTEQKKRFEGLSPLREKEFRLYIGARFFYIMALRMVGTVVAYQLFQITRDSFTVGLVGLSEFVPVFVLALYAGYKIDRSDKRTLLLKGILSYSLCIIALIIVTGPLFTSRFNTKTLELSFYAIIFFTGVIRAFSGPTSSAILAQLVPRNILHLAASISSTTWLSASILGHASAGLFIAWFGVHTTFYIVLAYILIASFFISRISKKPIAHNAGKHKSVGKRKGGIAVCICS